MNGEKNDYKEFQANQGFSSSTNEMSDVPPAPTNQNLLTEEEKEILAHTSRISSKVFLPFTDDDQHDLFTFPIPYSDPDGFLQLSPEQQGHFQRWQRISEIFRHKRPKIVQDKFVDWISIRQSVVGDCSFLSALVVAAFYEKRFGTPLITSTIYPKDEHGVPVYNPSGKYTVKMHMNGIARKIVIDDYLPVSSQNQLLCAHSSNPTEFWVSLLEKAYMKLMGGYNFPGSEGGRDLHALTGWIPEIIQIQDKDANFDALSLFDRLRNEITNGRCLITIMTSPEISQMELKRVGLVERHAYAVLDMREANGVKLLQLKNPWSHIRWQGNYSDVDSVHWTKELQQWLGFIPKKAEDNGVFWIDYGSLLFYFNALSVNWNPSLFQFTHVVHEKWIPDTGLVAQATRESPQYVVTVDPGHGSIWVLLTSHITSLEDISQKREFIRLQAYLNNGRKVLFPNDYFMGEKRINSQHFLAKLKMDPSQKNKYTIVVTQYNKTVTNYYTIRIYCGVPFDFKPLSREHFVSVKKLSKNIQKFLRL